MYYETYRRELRVPRTFADYNQIARFFTRSLNQASPVPYGTTAAIGNVVVSPSEFFPFLYKCLSYVLAFRSSAYEVFDILGAKITLFL